MVADGELHLDRSRILPRFQRPLGRSFRQSRPSTEKRFAQDQLDHYDRDKRNTDEYGALRSGRLELRSHHRN